MGTEKIAIWSSYNTEDTKVLAEDLVKIDLNIGVKITEVDYYTTLVKNKPDIFRVSMAPSFPDPEEYYSLFYSKSGKNINLTGYQNPKFDQIFEKSLTEESEMERIKLYLKLEELLKNDVAFIPISYSEYSYFIVKNYIENFSLLFGTPNYKNMGIKRE